MVINHTMGQDKIWHMCQCPTCTTYTSKSTERRLLAPEEDNNNNNNNDNNNNSNNVNMWGLPGVMPKVPLALMQQPPAFFVPSIPLASLASCGWMLQLHDCCYMVGNYYHCAKYAEYLCQKKYGMQVLGKPLHRLNCPIRGHLQC
jgi:hypothetical protein